MLGREDHVSRIIETRKSYGNLVGNDHFEDRRGFDDCENCSMGGSRSLIWVEFYCFGLIFDRQVCVRVRSVDPSSFVSLHKKSR